MPYMKSCAAFSSRVMRLERLDLRNQIIRALRGEDRESSGEVLMPRGPWQVEQRLIASLFARRPLVAAGAALCALAVPTAPASANARIALLRFVIALLPIAFRSPVDMPER